MKRWSVVIPVIALVAYCVGSLLVGPVEKKHHHWYYGEVWGPAEWGAAVTFLISGVLALRLAWRVRGRVPGVYAAFYVCFGLAGLLMAGEELSWGQHVLGFETPESIAERNKQAEFNLHNLAGDKPSSLLRRAAEIGFPALLIVLPIAHLVMSKSAYVKAPMHWPYWTLPRWEAVTATLLGNLCRPIDQAKLWGIQGADEMAEALWGLATVFWIVAVSRRVLGDLEREASGEPNGAVQELHPPERRQ